MSRDPVLDLFAVPWLFLITVTLLATAYTAGVFWGRRTNRLHGPTAGNSYVGTVITGMFALLGFILGFAFIMASNRFDDRKHLVLEEANAIGTTWLRARALPQPYPDRIVPLLRQYVDVRLGHGASQWADMADMRQALKRSGALHHRLWDQTIELTRSHPQSLVVALFMKSLNQMIDLHESRVGTGLYFRVSPSVWRTLYFVAALTLITAGYEAGRGGARHPAPVVISLVVTLSIVFVLIIDLDRPSQHLFRVNKQALVDLRNTMNRAEEASGAPRRTYREPTHRATNPSAR